MIENVLGVEDNRNWTCALVFPNFFPGTEVLTALKNPSALQVFLPPAWR
jgi:hypothetical protein